MTSAAQASGPATRQRPARLDWMDLLRGSAVLLIVLWHAVTVPEITGAEVPDGLRRSLTTLSPYRVPLMVFLSGMLLPRSLAKPPLSYLMGKARYLVWPFVVWTVIMALVWPDLRRLLVPDTWWHGSYHLWFLAMLMLCYALAPIAKVVPAWVLPLPLVWASQVIDQSGLSRMFWFAAFFFAGAAAMAIVQAWQRQRPPVPLLLAVVAVGFGVVVMTDSSWYQFRHFPSFAMSLVGIGAALWIAPRVPQARWLTWAGRNSLIIYLAHFPAILLAWRLAERAGFDNWWILTPVLTAVGVAVPVVLSPLRNSLLFRLPGARRR